MQNKMIKSESIEKVDDIPPIPEGWMAIEIPSINSMDVFSREADRYYDSFSSFPFDRYTTKMESGITIKADKFIFKIEGDEKEFFKSMNNKKCLILIKE